MTCKPDNSGSLNTDEPMSFGDNGKSSVPTDAPLSIGNVSRMLGVSRFRLWSYERLGLIKRRRRFGQGFVYRWDDLARLSLLIKARRIGLSARRLAPLIKAADAEASIESIKAAQLQCLALIDLLELRRQSVREAIAEIRFFHRLLSDNLPGSEAGGAPDRRGVS
jgi:DNA-binding transcriptional MerR regulator